MIDSSDPTAQPLGPNSQDPAPDPALDAASMPPPVPPAPDHAGPPPPPPPPVLLRSPGGRGGVSRGLLAVLAPVLAVVVFAGGVAFGRSGLQPDGPSTASATPGASVASGPDADLALVEQAWRDIQDNYVDAKNLDNRAMAYAAISGLTTAVGDVGHTSFMTAEEAKAADQSLSGTFVGIGVQLSSDTSSGPVVGTVIPGTPAEEAGLRRGDRIVAVGGKTTAGETIDQTVGRVRGPEGTPVTITIQRAGVPNFDVTMTRRKFDLPLVSWTMVPGRKVAMIRLEQFATGATKGIKDAITKAKAAGATAIILDLRMNPGGYVGEAVGVTSQFVGDGIVYQAFDRSGVEKDQAVESGGLATDMPMVVLADADTASAAEIVTGAIQDAKRGTVVGEKTFGTGTVLGRFDLADGSVLRIGVERWLTRNGRPIWHEGLEPDVKVALPTAADPLVPLVPTLMRDMTEAQLAQSKDAQVLKALELLVGKG